MTRSAHSETTTATKIGCWILDGLVLAAVAAVLFVAVTGGTTIETSYLRASLTRTGNPIVAGALLFLVRYLWFRTVPFLVPFTRRRPIDLDPLAVRARTALADTTAPGWARYALAGLIAASVALRLINAWAHPGFSTGDDVEIHEMTLGRLLGTDWDVWELRSSFYPMTVVYPLQALAFAAVGDDVEALVFAGRLAVVAVSTMTVWLVYRITLALGGNHTTALCAAAFAAVSRLHLWFGSSELPRPVVSVLLLAAFWLLLRAGTAWRSVAAGLLIGTGGAMRFGEFVFIVPALLQLALERRWQDAMSAAGAAAAAALLCLGLADWWYWGTPWSSLQHIVDYTLVRGESSRGFQPFAYYVTHVHEWTNIVMLVLGAYALTLRERRAALWAWVPVVLLSLLPHKEARYVIPVLPFLAIAGALALRQAALRVRSAPALVVIVAAAFVAVLYEGSNWRARRSDDAVRLAQRIAGLAPPGVAAEQLWRLGGRLYFGDVPGAIIELREPDDTDAAVQAGSGVVLVLRSSGEDEWSSGLAAHGYVPAPDLASRDYLAWRRR